MSYQAAILTVSDSCAAGTRTDTSGPAIRAMLENAGFAVQAMQTVPDEEGQISAAIVHACDILQADLVVTTGGHRALSVRRDAGGNACRARPRDPRHPRRHVGRGTEVDAAAIDEMRKKPVDTILCTGGMSVDPDDNTPGAIARSGARIVTYGAPVLPGAMFLLGYYEDGQPVMGLPGCVMYAKATILDLILPRVAAGLQVTNQEIAVLDSYLKWELELGELLGAFDGPILWVSHDLGECCRNCARVCVMENGQTGALQPVQALLDAPASVSAARLTGCKNFFLLTKDGCVDGWPLQLPARRDGAAILAVPQTALELGGSGTPFRILRIIPDAGHAILLLQPEGAAEGSPVLRAECDAAGTYAAGQTLPVSFREEKLLFF